MPYIKRENRPRLDWIANNLAAELSGEGVTGNLNYILFKTFVNLQRLNKCNNYQSMSRYLAELHEAAEEIRRRKLAPYEDQKIKINGDVE